MSAANPPPAAAPTPHAPHPAKKEPNEITIISHSGLYYWWPVWACGFLMAIITFAEGYVTRNYQGRVMAVVPGDSKAFADGIAQDGSTDITDAEQVTIKMPKTDNDGKPVKGDDGQPIFDTKNYTKGEVHVIVTPQDAKKPYIMPTTDGKSPASNGSNLEPPHLHISTFKSLGVTFVLVLLLVVTITNVPLRGMWSLLIIVTLVSLTIIFIVLGWMDLILIWFYLLDVRINMAGYMTISLFLLVIWLVALLIFDKQRYITFTPGQFKVCDEIGGGEQVYSTDGMTLQKQRSDFFRHYILGIGSGDLIVRTAGAQGHHYDLPNVLFINQKVKQIEELIARKAVVETR
jgi:hypothetical protein